MLQTPQDIQQLDRESYRIVGMICSESVPEAQLLSAMDGLRRLAADVFPEDPHLFDRIYGRRFARLRTRFRPSPALFPATH